MNLEPQTFGWIVVGIAGLFVVYKIYRTWAGKGKGTSSTGPGKPTPPKSKH